ncbi:protein SCO1/2 [Methylobacterium sp. 174MFSha1.1]|uniref:SCO family protein n=1 Tax=Methylobacterium sp. 174MFSha1.1 TaxID=1502749 RepID=UPI0008EED759|nr:SCO family protein [Methylobacterium sp. 174MFSha1.1]SFU46096.1 protein SCO1/2 [Methylobacterium sp. 174MFSha1.1]
MNRSSRTGLARAAILALAGLTALSTPSRSAPIEGRARAADPVVIDAELLGTDGRAVRFRRDVLGRGVTLVSFTFIGCRVQCPISDQRVTEVEDALAARGRGDIRLVTLTIDPNNQPEDLRRHADAFAPGPARRFLTGSFGELIPLLDGLGLSFGSMTDHDFFFLLFDREGRFVGRIEGLEATAERLAAALVAIPGR